jgi:hypothetical protein
MSSAIPEKYRDLFSKRAFASLGTLMPDGRPQVTPVWCDLEGDLVIFNSAKGRQKTATSAATRAWPWPSSIRTILIAIWKSAAAWLKSPKRRRRAHRQDGQEVSGRGQVSLPPADRDRVIYKIQPEHTTRWLRMSAENDGHDAA